MKKPVREPLSARYAGLRPASEKASTLAAKASRKTGTACEVMLARALRELGLKFKKNVRSLPGRPDLVFERDKLAVFVDGDFWHGRRLTARLAKLSKGHNSEYWIQKIQLNVVRDRRVRRQLKGMGWHVMRVWEGNVKRDPSREAARVARRLGL